MSGSDDPFPWKPFLVVVLAFLAAVLVFVFTDIASVLGPEEIKDMEVALAHGELIEVNAGDVDSVVDAFELVEAEYQRAKAAYDAARQARNDLAVLLDGHTEGDAVTRRVRGARRQAAVTQPDVAWDQARLKEVANAYPKLSAEVLRVAELGVIAAAYKKIQGTKGDDAFNLFRDMLARACKGRVGSPKITIEK